MFYCLLLHPLRIKNAGAFEGDMFTYFILIESNIDGYLTSSGKYFMNFKIIQNK